MDPLHVVLFLVTGAIGGFIAGLIGIGGGVIFGPVFFFYFRAIGVEEAILTPLVLGTSLFCTLAASAAGTVSQLKKDGVHRRVALVTGGCAAVAVLLMSRFVTTQPWYDARAFQVVLGVVLLVVVVRMLRKSWQSRQGTAPTFEGPERTALPFLGGTGLAAGSLAAAAGVGGGVILVPAYNSLVRLPLQRAVGTSTATIVLISLMGVATYAFLGLGANTPPTAIGYVDVGRGLLLALPTMLTARLGVKAVYRLNVNVVRLAFAAFAAFVALRLLWESLVGP
ncbi:MAG: sulfite exporter TauE/SafE family protein [Bacteroidota bacterium]